MAHNKYATTHFPTHESRRLSWPEQRLFAKGCLQTDRVSVENLNYSFL